MTIEQSVTDTQVMLPILNEMISKELDNLNDIISAAFWRWQELYSPDSGRERVRHLLEKYL